MANPTTNYGFVLPTSSDLVTDLPADFDVALQGVDTRLKALQPGTTLGDLAYSSATANTSTRLPIGTSGQVLAVSGGVPAWTTSSSGSMTLLSTTSLTGSTVTLSSISQSYRDLRIEIKDLQFSANNSEMFIRYNGDTGTNYDQIASFSQVGIANNTTGYENFTSNNLTYYYTMQNTSANAAFQLDLYDYKDTTAIRIGRGIASYTKGYSTAGDRILVMQNSFYKNVGTTISQISFTMSTGTFSAGTVTLYGVN
jgi:hypothetical protein